MNGHCWILGPHPNPMIASCSFWPDLTLVQPCFSIASRFSIISLKLPPLLQIRQPYICPLSVNLWDFLPPRNWIHFPVQNVRWLQASEITQPRSLPDNSRPKIQCVREREVKWPQPASATRLDFPGIPRGLALAAKKVWEAFHPHRWVQSHCRCPPITILSSDWNGRGVLLLHNYIPLFQSGLKIVPTKASVQKISLGKLNVFVIFLNFLINMCCKMHGVLSSGLLPHIMPHHVPHVKSAIFTMQRYI